MILYRLGQLDDRIIWKLGNDPLSELLIFGVDVTKISPTMEKNWTTAHGRSQLVDVEVLPRADVTRTFARNRLQCCRSSEPDRAVTDIRVIGKVEICVGFAR